MFYHRQARPQCHYDTLDMRHAIGYLPRMMNISNATIDIASTVSLILSASIDNGYYEAIDDIQTTYGESVKISSGAYRSTLMLDDAVVKFSLLVTRQKQLLEEAEFIQRMRNDATYGRHFPETYVVQVGEVPVLVQEKVRGVGRLVDWDLHEEVERLAERLGITDMHEENYGWAGPPRKQYPVFIDVDFRGKIEKRRSWFV